MSKRERKPIPVPARVQRLVAACRGGADYLPDLRAGVTTERAYCLNPSGRPVGEWTFRRALDLGLLKPVGDGLFPDAESQTYRVAQ